MAYSANLEVYMSETRTCPRCDTKASKCKDPVNHFDPDWEEEDDE